MSNVNKLTTRFVVAIILVGLLFNLTKSNKYEVIYSDSDVIKINRKGQSLKFSNINGPFPGVKAGDSVTLWGDYDFIYTQEVINN